jgi:hypothetical protein
MKKIFTIALLFIGASAFAQTSTSTTTTSTQTAPALTPKAKALCKTWKLTTTENFGDQHQPTDKQKNDLLLLMEGGRYRLIMDGVAEGGTWTFSKDNLWITLTTESGSVKKLKVLESTESSLKVDYRDADDIHNILIYSGSN